MPDFDDRYDEPVPVQAANPFNDEESQRILDIPKSDSSQEGGQSDDENDRDPVAQAANGPQNLGLAPQQAIIDRRQREIDNNVPFYEERKVVEIGEGQGEAINQERVIQEEQQPLEVNQAAQEEIDELDEDEIDLLLETAHDPPELQPDERTRVEFSNKFVVRSQHLQSRGLFQKAKKTGRPVQFHHGQ